MIAVGFPPLTSARSGWNPSVLLGLPFFDPTLGGEPLLWQHLSGSWAIRRSNIIFLPGAGVVATMLPVFVGDRFVGYGFVVARSSPWGFSASGSGSHHMFATGLPNM